MYRIYRNDGGQLALLVYPVSGNGALGFEEFVDAVDHGDRIIIDGSASQYVIMNEETKKIVAFI